MWVGVRFARRGGSRVSCQRCRRRREDYTSKCTSVIKGFVILFGIMYHDLKYPFDHLKYLFFEKSQNRTPSSAIAIIIILSGPSMSSVQMRFDHFPRLALLTVLKLQQSCRRQMQFASKVSDGS